MKESTKSLLIELRSRLAAIYGPRLRKIVLFGSVARGDERADSDIDILVVLDDFEDLWVEMERTGEVMADLALKYDRVPVVIPIREDELEEGKTPFLLNVRKEGITLS